MELEGGSIYKQENVNLKQIVYPEPVSICSKSGIFLLNEKSVVYCTDETRKASEFLTAQLHKLFGILIDVKQNVHDLLGLPEQGSILQGSILLKINKDLKKKDEYILSVGENIVIEGATHYSLIIGIQSLLSLIRNSGDISHETEVRLGCVSIHDYPFKPFRGVHLYLPPPDGVEEFKRILDVISRLKYNSIILEIGGGMQYDRHPEINAAWLKFCRQAREHPKGPQGLQASEAYWKDSTHVENAGGFYLTKEQVRKIADYAELLGLEIIPEIQSLSHAYYLTLADRTIAERPFETWPDTYCPMNDDSYRLYFDVAEEIYEVLKYKTVSIGHDEVRILGECEHCRNYSGHELLARDINRLYEFYKKKGISVMMWGEKLQTLKIILVCGLVESYRRKLIPLDVIGKCLQHMKQLI
jgi:hypothetical protein